MIDTMGRKRADKKKRKRDRTVIVSSATVATLTPRLDQARAWLAEIHAEEQARAERHEPVGPVDDREQLGPAPGAGPARPKIPAPPWKSDGGTAA